MAVSGGAPNVAVLSGPASLVRLQQLGIAPQRLYTALDAGDVAARQADEFSSVNAAGTLRWHETVRALRQGLTADGWSRNDDRNSPRIIDPAGKLAVVPVSGSPNTGVATRNPTTANPRGEASSRAVHVNDQLQIAEVNAFLADMAAEKSADLLTYFLLYYRSEHDELRSELSMPVAISDRGIVARWSERILLPARHFDAELPLPRDAGGDDDIDFTIVAR